MPLKRGSVGVRCERAALKRRYKPARDLDKAAPLRRLANEVGGGMKFIGNLESERLGCCIS